MLIRRTLPTLSPTLRSFRRLGTSSNPPPKASGDISSVFPSLSGKPSVPLPDRFTHLKTSLLSAHPDALRDSWHRLLPALSHKLEELRALGPAIIPSIDFSAVKAGTVTLQQTAEIKKRGVAIIRGVIPVNEALALKEDAKNYIAANRTEIKAFPADNPAVYELYWTPSQVAARANTRLLSAQVYLQQLWTASSDAEISIRTPLTYADRLRIRPPGDAAFALGPHVDGGSLERWEDPEYRRCYEAIMEGRWEEHNPYDATHRMGAKMDLYNGAGACAMFRMWQGWLSMSATGPGEGTLRVMPAVKETSAYMMLRPLMAEGWPGSEMGMCQELRSDRPGWHNELGLETGGMVSVPRVEPGDFVAWHCDVIHSVESQHMGKRDSSVLYIPATPLTDANMEYLERQKRAAEELSPAPDFPGAGSSKGEAGFVGAVNWEKDVSEIGRRAMGMGSKGWETKGMSEGEKKIVNQANSRLFGVE